MCIRDSSHTIFSVEVNGATLRLADLAGSEKWRTEELRDYSKHRIKELTSINQSLSALANVVSALKDGRPHVPYRDSKLTRLLQASLGGTARTALIACCAPGGDATGETKSTLEFAARARKVVVRAAPRDVAVDYQSLYEEVKDSIDDYRTRERKALDEVESLKDKEEATQSRILELERETDALKHALQRQQQHVAPPQCNHCWPRPPLRPPNCFCTPCTATRRLLYPCHSSLSGP